MQSQAWGRKSEAQVRFRSRKVICITIAGACPGSPDWLWREEEQFSCISHLKTMLFLPDRFRINYPQSPCSFKWCSWNIILPARGPSAYKSTHLASQSVRSLPRFHQAVKNNFFHLYSSVKAVRLRFNCVVLFLQPWGEAWYIVGA